MIDFPYHTVATVPADARPVVEAGKRVFGTVHCYTVIRPGFPPPFAVALIRSTRHDRAVDTVGLRARERKTVP